MHNNSKYYFFFQREKKIIRFVTVNGPHYQVVKYRYRYGTMEVQTPQMHLPYRVNNLQIRNDSSKLYIIAQKSSQNEDVHHKAINL